MNYFIYVERIYIFSFGFVVLFPFVIEIVLDLAQCFKTISLQLSDLCDSLPYLLLFDQPLNYPIVLLGSVEPSKHSHHVVNLFLVFRPRLVKPHLLSDVQQLSANHEVLSLIPLRQFMVVDVHKPELHCLFLLGIIFIELHLCEQELSIVIVLNFKVTSSWHKPYNFCWISVRFWRFSSRL